MKRLLLTILIVFLHNLVLADDYQIESFTKESSPLPSNNITSLQYDTDGILWIGSDSGLTGFDGSTWITYNTSNSDSLANDQINDISIVRKKFFVAGNSGLSQGEINSIDDLNWISPINTTNTELLNDSINAVNIDSTGNLWMGTEKGVSYFSDKTGWSSYTPPVSVPIIAVNKQASRWQHFGTKGFGVLRLKNNEVDGISAATFLLEPYNIISNTVQATLVETNGDRWYGTPQGITYHTGDDSKVYTLYNTDSGLVNNNVQALSEDSSGSVWIGTSAGLSKFSPDNKWFTFTMSDGLASDDVQDITVDSKGIIWIATSGGLSRLIKIPTVINDHNLNVANDFNHSSAYPNPFNMSTTIKFQINSTEQIKISIFDINGRLVNTILNSSLIPGSYKVNWNGKNAAGNNSASGVYFAGISSSGRRSFLKLILIK